MKQRLYATRPDMWSAAVDYVRLTCKGVAVDSVISGVYRRAVEAIVARTGANAPSYEQWAHLGYRGWVRDGMAYGTGQQGSIFQASGYNAAYVAGLGLPWDNCPRVDLQVTAWYDGEVEGLIRECADMAAAASSARGGAGRQVRYIDGYGNGDTTYIGSRSSDTFLRIYDKKREGGITDWAGAVVRYEVEFKGDKAAQVWDQFRHGDVSAASLRSTVYDAFRAAGLVIPALYSEALAITPEPRYNKTDTDSRMNWLRQQVAPSVRKLLSSGVSGEQVLRALELI